MGLAAGVGVTLLLRRGPSGRRPLVSGMEVAGRGARLASLAGVNGARVAGRAANRGAQNAKRGVERGVEWAEDLPLDDVASQIMDYFEAAKSAVEDTVTGELQDLRKSIRRKRRRFGI